MDIDERMHEVEQEIISRRPEHSVDLALDRMADLVALLGDPQRACPVIHITGTNGKTSTARMIDALLRSRGLRTGRFTSPHLVSIRERICVDGAAVSPERFVEAYEEILPFVALVDDRHPVAMSFFEVLTGMAFAIFALSSPYGYVGLLSPALILFFLFKVTGIPATEAQALRSRGEDYRRYQETTSAFVPWFPRR